MMKKVSAIIVNINSKDLLNKCLINLKDIYENLEVIVVDNSSTDGTPDMVRKDFPWVKLVESENYGLAAGLNLALKQATGDYFYYLGNDTFPNTETFVGLVNYFESNLKVGAATSKVVTRDGNLDWDTHRGFPTPWVSFTHFSGIEKLFPKSKLFGGYFLSYQNMTIAHEIDMSISHSLFVRRATQEDVGAWDENFFVYGEDVDMCFRIKQAGWKIMYLPQFEAIHWKGVIVGRKTSQDLKPVTEFRLTGKSYSAGDLKLEIKRMTTQAMKLFYDKHYRNRYPILVTWLVHVTVNVMTFVRVLLQKYLNWKMGLN